jgi:hypothetical protein
MNKDIAACEQSFVKETKVNGVITFSGPMASNPDAACVRILDLMTVNPRAKGFRRGFIGHPYGYLSPGTDQILVRIDLLNFGLTNVKMIDLAAVNPSYGGYSGGFADNLWACYT